MRYLYCPQCDVNRFFVKDKEKATRLVQVTWEFEVVAVKDDESLEGFDLNTLFCVGCSWSGSLRKLVRYHKH